MALLTVYEKQGADGVTYRVALGNEATTRGDGGIQTVYVETVYNSSNFHELGLI